jgi:acetoacetyl-CoA synthetase
VQPALTCSTIETLTSIWQRLFSRQPIPDDKNFFELGGNPPMAIRLFADVSRLWGRDLSPLFVYAAPTIAQQAALLEQDAAPRLPPLLLLRKGIGDRPIYISHGLGSSVMELFELVKSLPAGPAVYGMQARGSDGLDEPYEHIEDMAQRFLNAIRLQQPEGPYSLIGYSLGGLITLEIARQIEAQGNKIAIHVMIDSYPPLACLSLPQRARLLARRAKRRVLRESGQQRQLPDVQNTNAMRRVRERSETALQRYRPKFYAGKVKFVRASKLTDFPSNPDAAWGKTFGDMEVETVPGDHLDLLTTNVDDLAATLSRYLKEVYRSE